MISVKAYLTLAAIVLTLSSPACAQSRSFYDRNGHFAGSSSTHGNQTTFTDRNGRFSGSAIRNSDGTTSFNDRSGHFAGSSNK
jgi:hypothetical protein